MKEKIITLILVFIASLILQKIQHLKVEKLEPNYHKVKHIVDGDTIIIDTGEKVRLIGINTPEVYPEKECYGTEAQKEATKLLKNKKVRLEFDVEKQDRYERKLAYVFLEEDNNPDIFINNELVKKGLAYSKTYGPNTYHQKELDKSMKQAQKDKLGLWGNCD